MSFKNGGQATVEYLLLILFLLALSYKVVLGFTEYMSDAVGNLGHVLSYNLSVGICESECFYKQYYNGYRK